MLLAQILVTMQAIYIWTLVCVLPSTHATAHVKFITGTSVSKIAAKNIKHLLKDTKMRLDVRLVNANARILNVPLSAPHINLDTLIPQIFVQNINVTVLMLTVMPYVLEKDLVLLSG